MPISHALLAILVVIIWGVNFLFVKIGLLEVSPLLLCALRFVLASIPAIFFIKRPAVPFRMIALYGLVVFSMQFGFLFWGLYAGMTAGMASLIMQVQVFFSIFFAVMFLDEQPQLLQLVGALVAFTGIGLVATHFDETMSLLGFLLILLSAASMGLGNLITKQIKTNNLIALVVWGSFVSSGPMLLCALIFEGPSSFVYTYEHLSWRGLGALLYIVYASTWIGYGLWNWLISRYPVSTVVPFTLLVPVVGILSSALVLGDPFELWQLYAGLLVLSGLGINLISARLFYLKRTVESLP